MESVCHAVEEEEEEEETCTFLWPLLGQHFLQLQQPYRQPTSLARRQIRAWQMIRFISPVSCRFVVIVATHSICLFVCLFISKPM